MTDILQAARSYYGLADTECCTTQLFTNQAGQVCVAFEIPLSTHDFERIMKRMKSLDEIASQEQPDTAIIEGPTVEAMREAYNALSKAEKGRYGSFARYMAERSTGIIDVYTSEPYENAFKQAQDKLVDGELNGTSDIKNPRGLIAAMQAEGRQVVHVDTPEEPEPTNMDAVWLRECDCNHAQIMHSTDWDNHTGKYLVQWAMLTDEQKQKAKP